MEPTFIEVELAGVPSNVYTLPDSENSESSLSSDCDTGEINNMRNREAIKTALILMLAYLLPVRWLRLVQ